MTSSETRFVQLLSSRPNFVHLGVSDQQLSRGDRKQEMNTRIGPLGKLDRSREPKYLHAVQMQLIPNRLRGRADTGCSSPVSLRSLRSTSLSLVAPD